MTSTVVAKPDEYRGDAEECWKFANDAQDIETKAVLQLTAEAWTMLAAQSSASDSCSSVSRSALPWTKLVEVVMGSAVSTGSASSSLVGGS
jgi:hypothetical protein